MSRRVPFLIAVANGMGQAVINNLENVAYVPAHTDYHVRYDRLIYTRDGNDYGFLIHKIANEITTPVDSAAANLKWDIWMLLPESLNWRVGPLAQRLWYRLRVSDRNVSPQGRPYIHGPWSLPEAARQFPTFADNYLRNELGDLICPGIFFGDPVPEAMALTDYCPTDGECNDDTEPDEEGFFPELPPPPPPEDPPPE